MWKRLRKQNPQIVYTYSRVDNSGYTILFSVLLMGAVGVAIVVSIVWFGINASQTSLVYTQLHQAQALADACAEEALQEIRDSTPYTGSETLSLGGGTCSYTVTNDGGQNRTITSSGTMRNTTRRLEITIDTINPDINVTSWQEVADF